ncbi:hypothetical protein MNBD_IGNAVI01-2621 [hydrothermal vent metagenome]|uniref:Rhodanese domain-containing protein n=1 Tax=hydrothermal vent metagenome TaxID=652676 RepID=A0A3B1CC73_9ZZZZ
MYESYLSKFNYEERKKMKIQIPELLELVKKDEVQFIDVRFHEEYEAWNISFAKNIPLNELPGRLDEIDKSKLVVTACPHYDRAIMGRIFLLENGFNARYLTDGLLGLVDYLRGNNAKELFNKLND